MGKHALFIGREPLHRWIDATGASHVELRSGNDRRKHLENLFSMPKGERCFRIGISPRFEDRRGRRADAKTRASENWDTANEQTTARMRFAYRAGLKRGAADAGKGK